MDAVIARYGDADFCVLAGDLTDMGTSAAYERLKHLLSRLPIPVHITLGNHDDRPTFLSVFGDDFAAETGKVDKVLDVEGYRIILLDSSEPGRVDGVLEAAQIAWLRARLSEAMDRPVIVIRTTMPMRCISRPTTSACSSPTPSPTRCAPTPISGRSLPATST